MKFLVIALACSFILASNAAAQYREGGLQIGGSAGFSGYHDEFSTDKEAGFTLSFGRALSDTHVMGLEIGATFPEVSGVQAIFAASPFLRVNRPIEERFGAFFSAGPIIGYTSMQNDVYVWSYGAAAKVGGYWFPWSGVSIELALADALYMFTTYRHDGNSLYDAHYWDVSLETFPVSLAVYFHF